MFTRKLLKLKRISYDSVGVNQTKNRSPFPLIIRQISYFRDHSLALIDGKVYGIGANNESQLSDLKPVTGIDQSMGSSSIIQTLTKIDKIEEKIIKIGCGAAFSVCLTENGKLIGWGQNDEGQLGQEESEEEIIEPKILIENVLEFSAGYYHIAVITKDLKVLTTGEVGSRLGRSGEGKGLIIKKIKTRNKKNYHQKFSGQNFHSLKKVLGFLKLKFQLKFRNLRMWLVVQI